MLPCCNRCSHFQPCMQFKKCITLVFLYGPYFTCSIMYMYIYTTISLYIMNMHSYCQNTSMRLFVIGHFQKGKSTLIAALRRRQQSSSFDERTKRSLDPDYHLTEDGMYVVHVCGCMYMYIYTYNYVHCTVGMITHNKANSC